MKAIQELNRYIKLSIVLGYIISMEYISQAANKVAVENTLNSINDQNHNNIYWISAMIPYAWVGIFIFALWMFAPEIKQLIKKNENK